MTHQHSSNCKNILQNLSAYIDGDLDQAFCKDIEAHLASCTNCQIVVNTLKKTIHLYQSDGRDTHLPTEVRHRLFSRLELDDYVTRDQKSGQD